MNPAIVTWLLDAAAVLGLTLLAACAAYALALILAPRAANLAGDALNRRISGRRAMRPLEIPRPTERAFYRHHRLLGTALLLAVTFFFLLYFLSFPRDSLLVSLTRQYGKAAGEAFFQATEWFFLLANGLIAAFSVLVLVRPSLLKPVETWANRWISTRQALKGLEREHDPLDRFVLRHPRLTGALLLAGVLYVAVGLLVAIS